MFIWKPEKSLQSPKIISCTRYVTPGRNLPLFPQDITRECVITNVYIRGCFF